MCVCVFRQQDLYRILKAYTVYRPDEGYCQAQAPVAAVLLMHMPAEVRQRWTKLKSSMFFFKKSNRVKKFWLRGISQDMKHHHLLCHFLLASLLVSCSNLWEIFAWILQCWVGEYSNSKRHLLGPERRVFFFFTPHLLFLCSSGSYPAGRRYFFLSSEESLSHGLPPPEEI